jgi:hypothetical protein
MNCRDSPFPVLFCIISIFLTYLAYLTFLFINSGSLKCCYIAVNLRQDSNNNTPDFCIRIEQMNKWLIFFDPHESLSEPFEMLLHCC